VSLTQLVETMYKICKVWGLNPGHYKKREHILTVLILILSRHFHLFYFFIVTEGDNIHVRLSNCKTCNFFMGDCFVLLKYVLGLRLKILSLGLNMVIWSMNFNTDTWYDTNTYTLTPFIGHWHHYIYVNLFINNLNWKSKYIYRHLTWENYFIRKRSKTRYHSIDLCLFIYCQKIYNCYYQL